MTEDIEEIRRRRMQQLIQHQMQEQQENAIQEQMQEAEISRQIKFIMNNILAPEARERLSNIRLVNPQYARQIEVLLIQLKQAGRLGDKLSDKELKQMLLKISSSRKDTKIDYERGG